MATDEEQAMAHEIVQMARSLQDKIRGAGRSGLTVHMSVQQAEMLGGGEWPEFSVTVRKVLA